MNAHLIPRLCLLFACSHALLTAEMVPSAFNYQGRLTDDQGQPLASGEYTIAFRLWDDPTSTSTNDPNHLIWGRERNVTMVGGAFNVILDDSGAPVAGAVLTAVAQAFRGPSRYLGLTVTRTPTGSVSPQQRKEILPRQQILSTPYALNAANGNPPGTIIAFGGENTPPGWLRCDGSVYQTNDFPELFAAIGRSWGRVENPTTFRVPQLTGVFLRGWSYDVPPTETYDPDKANRITPNYPGNHGPTGPDNKIGDRVGSVQADQFKQHQHSGTTGPGLSRSYRTVHQVGTASEQNHQVGWSGGPNNDRTDDQYANADHRHDFTTGFTGGSETRPVNVSVNYLIKH